MSRDTMENTERNRYANIAADEELSASEAAVTILKEYARERPEVVALWCFGIGFVLGWKLKPW
jgi:hypothetical protein